MKIAKSAAVVLLLLAFGAHILGLFLAPQLQWIAVGVAAVCVLFLLLLALRKLVTQKRNPD